MKHSTAHKHNLLQIRSEVYLCIYYVFTSSTANVHSTIQYTYRCFAFNYPQKHFNIKSQWELIFPSYLQTDTFHVYSQNTTALTRISLGRHRAANANKWVRVRQTTADTGPRLEKVSIYTKWKMGKPLGDERRGKSNQNESPHAMHIKVT